MDIDPNPDLYEYPKKTAGFNYLAISVGKRLQIAFFESNIWQNPDSTGKFKPAFGLVNPVIFTGTLFTGNRPDVHSLVGMNVKYVFRHHIVIYGQLMLDDVMNTAGKSGGQAGIKYFDAFGVAGLFAQAEYNRAEQGVYSFTGNTPVSYVHYNQAMAHPLGNNFRELVFFATYSHRRFRFEYRFNFAQAQKSNSAIPGEFAVYADGEKVIFNHIQAVWTVNPRTAMQIAAGYSSRNETSFSGHLHTGALFVAFRTALRNKYYDF
jgi:hypothetical protein